MTRAEDEVTSSAPRGMECHVKYTILYDHNGQEIAIRRPAGFGAPQMKKASPKGNPFVQKGKKAMGGKKGCK